MTTVIQFLTHYVPLGVTAARCAAPLHDSCVLTVTRLRVYCVFVLSAGSSQDVRASVTQEWLEICRLDSFDILKLLGTESEMLG